MDNENKKNAPAAPSDAGKSGKKHYHHNKKHYHKGNRPNGGQQKPEEARAEASVAPEKPKSEQQNNNINKNKNKKHNDNRKPRPEQTPEVKEEAPKAQIKNPSRQKPPRQTELRATSLKKRVGFSLARQNRRRGAR